MNREGVPMRDLFRKPHNNLLFDNRSLVILIIPMVL